MPSGASWTLEGELKELAQAQSITEALLSLRLIECEREKFEVVKLTEWLRGGAETYLLHFSVATPRGDSRFVIKACIAYAAGIPLSELFSEWLRRRDRLREFKVETPALIGRGQAVVVEEYIPLDLAEAFALPQDRRQLVTSLGWTAGRVAAAGFMPISIHDWRSRGRDVVLIDFGQDLGSADLDTADDGLLQDVLRQLDEWRVELTPSELRSIGQAYEQAVQ